MTKARFLPSFFYDIERKKIMDKSIIITAIICFTLVLLSLIGGDKK